FSVLLSITADAASVIETPRRAQRRTGSGLAGLNVLCIDNDRRILDAMRQLLENWGCGVETAGGSYDLDHLQPDHNPPDLVLADYHLDGEDGLDLIVALRARWQRNVPA